MLQYSDLLNFNWTSKEMNRFLLTFLFLNIGLFSSSAFAETNTFQTKQEYNRPKFNQHKSMLEVNANSQDQKLSEQQNVDFLKLQNNIKKMKRGLPLLLMTQ